MRLQKSLKNITFSFISNIFISVLGFVSRTVFIYTLGASYLGISGLLQNVFGLLAISELGISTAIGFSLYKPISNKDYKLISTLMTLYKKAYRIIGIFILIIGTILYGYLDFFVDKSQQPEGILYIYFLYLINIVFGYFMSYKTTLIAADQNAYKLVPIQMKITTITTVIQIIYLVIFRNYLGYLTLQILSSIILNIIQNRYITKKYDYIEFDSKEKLPDDEKRIIKKNIIGLMSTKIGDFCVNSTDNIIISKFIDLISVGIYSNYLLLRNLVNSYIGIIFGNITSSFGNLVAKENEEKCLEVFNKLFFISFVIYSFEAVCFICLFNPFITMWIGEEYLFSFPTVLAIVVNNYLTGLRIPIITIKNAAGIYLEDVLNSFGFAVVNLIASVVLAMRFGVLGVILGSIIGSLCTADWYRPLIVFRKVFKVSVKKYFSKYLKYLILGLAYIGISVFITNLINFPNNIINFGLKIIACIIIPNTITLLLFYKTEEFIYLKNILIMLFEKIKRKKV